MAFDDLIICLMRTLPEPSNFNIVWTGITYGQSLFVKGELPNARMNSLSLYCRGKSEPPVTIDFSKLLLSNSRKFSVLLHPANLSENELSRQISDSNVPAHVQYPSHWKGGYIAMRNYLVPPGTRVVTPSLESVGNRGINRVPEVLVAGNTGIRSHDMKKLRRVAALNIITVLFLRIVVDVSFEICCTAVLLGLVGVRLMYGFLFLLGKAGLVKHFSTVCPRPNDLFRPDVESASKVSQPSREHKYWVMRYDIRDGKDLLVSSRVKESNQKFWSLVVYDQYGLPLPQYVNDVNVQIRNGECTDSQRNGGEYDVRIRLTSRPPPSSQYDTSVKGASGEEKRSTGAVVQECVDLRGHEQGYVLFRLVHPVCEEVSDYSAPRVSSLYSNNHNKDD